MLKDYVNVYSISKDFTLLDKLILHSGFSHPFMTNCVIAFICTAGSVKGKVNMKLYESKAPCLMVILPNQILEYEYISENFEGSCIVMSKDFSESLNIQEGFSAFISVHNGSSIPLDYKELTVMLDYYSMMKNAIKTETNPHQLQVVKHLVKAFFYGVSYHFHKLPDETKGTKHEQLVDNLLNLIHIHFKEERRIDFYAEKLNFKPNYMSTIVKQTSGKSIGEWINERVILEVKVLLKLTNMTIQQIADELNFPRQFSFGKYFKRLVGLSPKEYRDS